MDLTNFQRKTHRSHKTNNKYYLITVGSIWLSNCKNFSRFWNACWFLSYSKTLWNYWWYLQNSPRFNSFILKIKSNLTSQCRKSKSLSRKFSNFAKIIHNCKFMFFSTILLFSGVNWFGKTRLVYYTTSCLSIIFSIWFRYW